MLPKSLVNLLLLQGHAVVRRMLRQARTPKGAFFFAIGVLVFVLWLLSALLTAQSQRPKPDDVRVEPNRREPETEGAQSQRPKPDDVRRVLPLIILGITLLTTLTSAGEKAIAFTGGEVDFLFPGPFTRRQLLLFKLTKGMALAGFTSLLVSVALYRNSTYWIASYLGAFVTLIFVQFASTAALLAGQQLGNRLHGRGKMLVLAGVVALAWMGMYAAAGPQWWDVLLNNPRGVLQRFAESSAGGVLLAPFTVLTRVITAERLWPDLPLWVLASLVMNGVLAIFMLRLDGHFVEMAARASERRYEKLRRFRSGGVLAMSASATARRSLPSFPRLGGAGTIAWRQLTHTSRASRTLLIVLLILAISFGPLAISASRSSDPNSVMTPIFVALIWMSILLTSMLRFDFRADLDSIETLKMLPIKPSRIAAGELFTPTLVMTLIHWAVIIATLVATAKLKSADAIRPPLLVTLVLCPPFNLLMFAAENLIFLLAPSRPGANGPGDFSLLGKQILTLIVRTVGVSIAASVAALFATLVYIYTNKSLPAMTATAFVVLTLEGLATIPLVGWMFKRFDPSSDMPG